MYNHQPPPRTARSLPRRLPAHLPQRCQAHACDGRCAAPTTFCGHPNERCLRLVSRTLPVKNKTVLVTSQSEDALQSSEVPAAGAQDQQVSRGEQLRDLDLLNFHDIRSTLLPGGNSTPNRTQQALSTFKPKTGNISATMNPNSFKFDDDSFSMSTSTKTQQRPDVLQRA